MNNLARNLFLFSLLIGCRSPRPAASSDLESVVQNQDLKNYSGSVTCHPGQILTPTTIEEIQAAVLKARDSKTNIRVLSLPTPRSYSPVICPEDGGIVLNVQAFNKIISVDPYALTAIVQPGILINELQDQLDPQGFTFPVTPDYNGVSLAGGMGTGAHHSSLRIPTAIADWVEEITLVDGNGVVRKLTGDDANLAKVHLGLLGVIVELKVRILPQSKIKYAFEKLPDVNLERDIVKLVKEHDYARVLWFPSNKTFILDHFDKVPLSTPGDSINTTWSSVPNISWLGDIPVGALNSSQLAQCAAEAIRVRTYAGSFKVSQSDSKAPVGLSHKMIAGTCEPGKCSWDFGIKTRTVEIGMPLDRVEEWIADVKAMIHARKACFPILGIYMRFSAASTSALGEASGHDSVVFEIHVPQKSNSALEPSSDVYDEMVQMTLAKYNGRPHWGKNSLPYFLKLGPAQFPQWDSFQNFRAELDPQGVFKSPFWSQIETNTPVAHFPGCAVTKQCICEADSDCGPKATCQAGVLFKEARVCRR